MDMLLRSSLEKILAPCGFADLKSKLLRVYIPTLKNGCLLRNILPCQRGYLDGQKALIYAACRGQKQSK